MKKLEGVDKVDRNSCEQARIIWNALNEDEKVQVLETIFLNMNLDGTIPVDYEIWKDFVRDCVLAFVEKGKVVIPINQLAGVFPIVEKALVEMETEEICEKVSEGIGEPKRDKDGRELCPHGEFGCLECAGNFILGTDGLGTPASEEADAESEYLSSKADKVVNCPKCKEPRAVWSQKREGGDGSVTCSRCGEVDMETNRCPECDERRERGTDGEEYCPRCDNVGFDISYRAMKDWKGSTPAHSVKKGDVLYPWLGPTYGASSYGVDPGEEIVHVTRKPETTPFFPVPKRILWVVTP